MNQIDKSKDNVKALLHQQHLLKMIRGKIAKIAKSKIHVITGDHSMRETIKGYLVTIGFANENIKTSNITNDIMSKIEEGSEPIDLIICRQKMLDSRYSEQTGFQFLNFVNKKRRSQGKKAIPFIFMENSFEKKDILAAFKSGASHFIVTPADAISVGQKVVDVFEAQKDSPINQEINHLLIEGNKLQEQGLYDDAIFCYNKAIEVGGDNVDVLNEKANTLMKKGDIDEAITLFKHITHLEENFPRAYQGLGEAFEQLGDIHEAKKNCLKVIELEPHNVQVHYNVGALYQEEGNYDMAKAYFKKGIGLNSKFVKNYLGLAKSFESEGNERKALDVYSEGIKQNPKQTFLYVTAGDFCLKHEMFGAAESIFGKALNQNESHLHLYNRMGIALRKQKKFDKAIENYEKALKVSPKDANLHYNLAKAYLLKGNETNAINLLQKAFDLSPELDLKLKVEEDRHFSRLVRNYPDKFDFSFQDKKKPEK